MQVKDLDTPTLLIDVEKVKGNIALAIEYAGGADRLRPHVKTHKILEVAQLQRAAGITKFKCATIAEAEMLGMAGAEDVLIAYPVQGPKVDRVVELILKFPETTYSVLVDNTSSARHVNKQFAEAQLVAGIFIDVNNGHGRTGIQPGHIPALVDRLLEMDHLCINGLHCYDGHIKMPSLVERVTEGRADFELVLQTKDRLEGKLGRNLVVVAGGSPSFSVHRKYHDVECSPGTWIFWDHGYGNNYPELAFEPAATLMTRVISKVDAHHYCLDLGHKSVASESPLPRAHFISGPAFEQIGHSEEHLMIRTDLADSLSPGEALFAIPNHVCPTVALYNHVEVVKGNRVIDRWRVIARDRKITV